MNIKAINNNLYMNKFKEILNKSNCHLLLNKEGTRTYFIIDNYDKGKNVFII